MEFRHQSWYVPDTYALLAAHDVALCLHDREGSAIDIQDAGPFVYVRFHGATGRYFGSYSDAALDYWAGRLASAWSSGKDVFAYFNNDPDAVAVGDAVRLRNQVLTLTGRHSC